MKYIKTVESFIELQQVIRKDVKNINEGANTDIIDRNLNLLDKAADMAIKNPTGNVKELANIIKKHTQEIRNSLK